MSIDNATPEQWEQAAYLANFTTANAAAVLTPEDIEGLNRVMDRPFGEVPYVTRAYVFLLHQMGKVRLYRESLGSEFILLPQWHAAARYQVEKIEPPKTKPSIDWSQIKPEYKWLARDSSGLAFAYTREPDITTTVWSADGGCLRADALVSYAPGDCDWKDSLVERPAGV